MCSEYVLDNFGDMLGWLGCLLNGVIPVLLALAVVGFIWGVIKYFLNPDNEEKRKNGKTFMIWGVIALFAITSVWGLVNLVTNTLDLDNDSVHIPQVDINASVSD